MIFFCEIEALIRVRNVCYLITLTKTFAFISTKKNIAYINTNIRGTQQEPPGFKRDILVNLKLESRFYV